MIKPFPAGRKLLSSLLMLCIIVLFPVYSTGFNSVDLDDPIYEVLQNLEDRHVVEPQSRMRPYPKAVIMEQLQAALASGQLSAAEEEILISYMTPDEADSIFETGRVSVDNPELNTSFDIGASFDASFAVPWASLAEYDSRNAVILYANGGIDDLLSFNMDAAVRIDKLDTAAWAPYTFSIPGEGFYLTYGNGVHGNVGYPDATSGEFANGFHTTPEVTALLLDKSIMLRWGMVDRDLGPASGNLVISEQARSFDALEFHWDINELFSYSWLTGTLTSYEDPDEYQNMLTTKRVDMHLPFGLSLGLHETVLWPKRFELGYLNPFMVTTLYQNILGDYDNMFAGLDFSWRVADTGRVYGTFMTDEMHHMNPTLWFQEVRDIFAFQAGIEFTLSVLPFSLLRIQYTNLQPFFYTHYDQDYPTYENDINTAYLNKGEPLGYYLNPDSDELKVEASAYLAPDVSFDCSYGFIRHSSQYGDDYFDSIDYDLYDAGGYEVKDFTGHLTEVTHVAAAGIDFGIPGTPITLGLSHSYSYSSYREYDDGDDSFSDWEANSSHASRIEVTIY